MEGKVTETGVHFPLALRIRLKRRSRLCLFAAVSTCSIPSCLARQQGQSGLFHFCLFLSLQSGNGQRSQNDFIECSYMRNLQI